VAIAEQRSFPPAAIPLVCASTPARTRRKAGVFDPNTPDLAGVGEGFDGLPIEAAKRSVSGTFSAAAVAGLGADSLAHARHSHNS
jgi:hypothetical protein